MVELTDWAIIITKPSSEEIAERSLQGHGYRVYLPRFRKKLTPHGRARAAFDTVMRPLFSRLLFVQDWRGWPITPVQGTVGLMPGGAKGTIAKLSDDDLSVIRHRELRGEYDDICYAKGGGKIVNFQTGDNVSIDLGDRISGTVEELSDNGKAIVRAIVFGRETRITVEAEKLEAVG